MKPLFTIFAFLISFGLVFGQIADAAPKPKNTTKPKVLSREQIEKERPEVLKWCRKKYGGGPKPVYARYEFGKWYCYFYQ